MKILRERKKGDTFQYRGNIVKVIGEELWSRCNYCQFRKQHDFRKDIKVYDFILKRFILVNKCEYKHKCSSRVRTDRSNIYYRVVKRL